MLILPILWYTFHWSDFQKKIINCCSKIWKKMYLVYNLKIVEDTTIQLTLNLYILYLPIDLLIKALSNYNLYGILLYK